MDSLSIILGLSNLFAGLLILALAWPLYRGKISRNHWYGFRTKKSLSSDEIWYATNKYGAKAMLPWAAALAGLGAGTLLFPLKPHPTLAIIIALAPILVIIPAIQTARYCHRYTAEYQHAKKKPTSQRRRRKTGKRNR